MADHCLCPKLLLQGHLSAVLFIRQRDELSLVLSHTWWWRLVSQGPHPLSQTLYPRSLIDVGGVSVVGCRTLVGSPLAAATTGVMVTVMYCRRLRGSGDLFGDEAQKLGIVLVAVLVQAADRHQLDKLPC